MTDAPVTPVNLAWADAVLANPQASRAEQEQAADVRQRFHRHGLVKAEEREE